MKIYVASSWRNPHQQRVVELLRGLGHEVYDFRNQSTAFGWSEILPSWPGRPTPEELREALRHPLAVQGREADQVAAESCDLVVLVLPAGSSSHYEFGREVGRGKYGVVYAPNAFVEPELVYADVEILASEKELVDYVGQFKSGTCCSCGYAGEEETPCPAREDQTHCEHWWDGTEEQAAAEEAKFTKNNKVS